MENELPETLVTPWKRAAIYVVEALLILAIVALLVATWLPAWVGGTPGLSQFQ